MSRGVSTVVLVILAMFFMDIWSCQTFAYLTCDKLPKLDIASKEPILVANSPYKVDHSSSPLLKCAATIISKPTCDLAYCHGTGVNIIGCSSSVVHYFIGSDNKTMQVSNCKTGQKANYHLAAAQSDNTGCFYCIYSCDGTALRDYKCASNNNGTSPAELAAVEMARKVPNGDKIDKARDNCPPSKGC